MLRQGKMKHNKEQFEYPKSIVIPRCEVLEPILVHMLRQGKMKHNKEQFEYPKSIVIPRCEGEYLLLPLIIH